MTGGPWERPAARLAGRTCLVTGAASGIGRAVARRYAQEGATVYGLDVQADLLHAEMAALRAGGATAHAVVADLRDPAAVERAVAEVGAAGQGLNVLANVAGVIALKTLEETSPEDWNRILSVNLTGPFLLCRAAAPLLRRAGAGEGAAVLNVSSRAGVMGFPDEVAYCASKWGLEGFSRAIAPDLGGSGVAVNTVTPGIPTHTAMSEQTYGPEARAAWRDPAEITPAFVWLALQGPQGLHDQYVNAWELSESLRRDEISQGGLGG